MENVDAFVESHNRKLYPAMSFCPSCDSTFDDDRSMKIHHSVVHGESIAKEEAECNHCGNQFEYYPSEKPGKYCAKCVDSGVYIEVSNLDANRGLSGEDNPNYRGGAEKECAVCGETKWFAPYEIGSRDNFFCSSKCYHEWKSERYCGDGNPNWKGGYNPNYSDGWWEARRLTLERDDYECQICHTRESFDGRNCDVHHKKPVREFDDPSDAHFLENLATLCRSCHAEVEHGDRKI